jgi:hypothetical protein
MMWWLIKIMLVVNTFHIALDYTYCIPWGNNRNKLCHPLSSLLIHETLLCHFISSLWQLLPASILQGWKGLFSNYIHIYLYRYTNVQVYACLYNSSMVYYTTYFKQLNDQLLLIAVTTFVYIYVYIHTPKRACVCVRERVCVCNIDDESLLRSIVVPIAYQ